MPRRKWTPEQRKEWSERRTGSGNPMFGKHRIISDKARENMSIAAKNKPRSKAQHAHIMKLVENNTGKSLSYDTKKKIRATKVGDKNPFFGKHHTTEVCDIISKTHTLKPKSYEQRTNMTETALGGFWYGAVIYPNYIACPKLTLKVKQQVRDRVGHCARCGCLPNENACEDGKVRLFAVHHALEEPLAFCSEEKMRMESLRKMMPEGVARFGEGKYSAEELWYVRLLVPLCHECHGVVTQSKESDISYEKTVYRKYFCELITNEYDGKCF